MRVVSDAMNLNNSMAALGCVLVAAASASPAIAQAPAASPAPGVCSLTRENLFGDSTVGKYVGQRLKTILDQLNAGLSAERTTFEKDVQAFQAQRATLTAAQDQTRTAELQQRLTALEAKAAANNREMAAIETDALERILVEATPIVGEVARQTGCGVVLDGKTVFVFLNNPSMDITASVIQRLNAKVTQIPVERKAAGILTRPAPK